MKFTTRCISCEEKQRPDLSQILTTIFNPSNKIITCGATNNSFKNKKQQICIKILCTN